MATEGASGMVENLNQAVVRTETALDDGRHAHKADAKKDGGCALM